ncbi:hypothetical protein ACF0H5_011767 [Mactra antiquata]
MTVIEKDSVIKEKEKDVTSEVKETPEVDIEEECPILYKIQESPSILLTIFFATQQSLISIAGSLVLPLLVAQAACALDSGDLIRTLLSSTLFLSGLTTLLQVTVGVRLPVYQGPSGSYAIPIIALNNIDPTRCSINISATINSTVTEEDLKDELINLRVREMMGPLILAGFIHFLIGATGLVGILLKYIGPITIVPTILLIGIYIVNPALDYVQVHWGIAFMTWAIGVILTLYLRHWPMVIPMWSREKGCHTIRYPLHQVFAILISIIIGWSVCGIMTAAGAFPDDKKDIMYKARTDARSDDIVNSPWIYIPHPGQFGSPLFSISAIVGFLIATLTSILDSIGDYYATAAMCRVPPPPGHAVNRGIAIEGFCSMLSGFFGIGHATTTYGGNIGAIGMTRVASRRVFVVVSFMYIILGLLAKVSAAFITIPYPVLGGSIISIIGVFVGVNLSNLNVIDLASTRNLSIIGSAIFIGLLVPTWAVKNPGAVDTGSYELDQVINMLIGNPNFLGGVIAFILDNTVPGTDVERGIAAWSKPEEASQYSASKFIEGPEVYDIWLPKCLRRRNWIRHIPICPKQIESHSDIEGKHNEAFSDVHDSNSTSL